MVVVVELDVMWGKFGFSFYHHGSRIYLRLDLFCLRIFNTIKVSPRVTLAVKVHILLL